MLGGLMWRSDEPFKPLVIFGAGASYDLIPKQFYPAFHENPSRPPITKGLLDGGNVILNELMERHPKSSSLIGTIRARMLWKNISLEEAFDEVIKESRLDMTSEINDFEEYLKEVFHNATKQNRKITGTNYEVFIGQLRQLREFCPEIMIINFNYDGLCKIAIEKFGNEFKYDSPLSYYTKPIKLIHIHGLVGDGETEKLTLPLIQGKTYGCPDEQVKAMQQYIPQANLLFIIGWKGNESHFKKDLMKIGSIKRTFIVHGGGMNPRSILDNCGLSSLTSLSGVYQIKGFSNFIIKYNQIRGNPDSNDDISKWNH
jgi:hypothetical protein